MKKFATLIVLMVLGLTSLNAQEDRSKFGATEEEQIICLEALQIYRTNRDEPTVPQSEKYRFWREAYNACPCTAGERMLSDGVKFIKKEIPEADAERRAILKDSLVIVYEDRIRCYPDSKRYPDGKNAHNVKASMIADLLKFKPDNKAELIGEYKTAVVGMGDLAKSSLISGLYVQEFDLLKSYIDAEDTENADLIKEDMILQYLDFSKIIKTQIAKAKSKMETASSEKDKSRAKKDMERSEKAQNNLDEIFKIIAECDQMIPILEKNVAAEPDNIDLKKKYLELMNAKNCTDGDFYLMLAGDVCKVEPSCDCLYSLGAAYSKKGENQKALDYLKQATEMCPSGEDGIKYNLAAAGIATNMGSCGTATKYANKVIALDPNNAAAYFIKGDCAQNMANTCDDGNLGRYCAYWKAADFYARAKAVDPSVTSKANTKIANVSVAFPDLSRIFKAGAKEGQSFDCGCFGTSTTIRAKK